MSASFSKPVKAWAKTFGYVAWVGGAGFLVPAAFLSGILIYLVHSGSTTVEQLQSPVSTVTLFAAQYLLGLGLISILPKYFEKLSPARLRERFGITRRPQLTDVGLALGTFAVYLIASSLFLTLIKLLIPAIDFSQQQDVGFQGVSDAVSLIASFFALVIMAPVAEELIFRGYLFGSIRPLVGLVSSVAVTSILFGLVHGQLNVGLDVAVLSVFLCLLRERTGSIWAGIFLHMTKNALAYFLLFVAPLLGIQIQ